MKFTISDCMSRINQALNYPAISYEDVSHFFDQAIAELNTSLRVAIPTVTEMRFENTFKISEAPNVVVIKDHFETTPISVVSDESFKDAPPPSETQPIVYYAGGSSNLYKTFYIWKNGEWIPFSKVYAIHSASGKCYECISVAYTEVITREVSYEYTAEFDLSDYLTTDWIILFLIPYVCFKFAVRNGDNGGIFNDEFTQGFQQLQTSYNVPNNVVLSTVAHRPAYKKLVETNLHDLARSVQTRAIYDDMKVSNGISKIHGTNVFDAGGWGV